ncbi:MAG TPA: homocysteine S-methyltransferase family protein, partial [Methylomirabilota bacterium]
MPAPLLTRLAERPLLCDGAMGTLLYARGVALDACFDVLNLNEPRLVQTVHAEYIGAGCDVVETNTFGANRLKLRAFGLTGGLRDINVQGARLAREAAGTSAYVAGAIGPLGLRIEPWGKMGRDEAAEYFREQAAALLEGGVDLFILETFRDLTEIGAAVDAIRRLGDLP